MQSRRSTHDRINHPKLAVHPCQEASRLAAVAPSELGLLPWRRGGLVMDESVREYLRAMARKGGSVKGEAKRRGDSEYYSRIARMRKPKKPPVETPAEETPT